MITSSKLFDFMYYESLPAVYRKEDDGTLENYLDSIVSSAYADIIDGEENLPNLINPLKCPEEFLPYLSWCYGLTYYPSIPAIYYRKILNNITELNRRRGTKGCLRYLCRVLTGMEINITYEELSKSSRILTIELLAESIADVTNMDLSIQVISVFIKGFVPYYITELYITSVISSIYIDSASYISAFVSSQKYITLPSDYEI